MKKDWYVCFMRGAKWCVHQLRPWKIKGFVQIVGLPSLPCKPHQVDPQGFTQATKNCQCHDGPSGKICCPLQEYKMEIGLPLSLWCELTLKFRSAAEREEIMAQDRGKAHSINSKWADNNGPSLEVESSSRLKQLFNLPCALSSQFRSPSRFLNQSNHSRRYHQGLKIKGPSGPDF